MIYRNPHAKDKLRHHMVTAGFIALAVLLFFMSRTGVLGDANQRYAGYALAVMLFIAIGRVVLTELGIRRRRGSSRG